LGEANGRDLQAWLAWYSQAGTPQLTAVGRYHAQDRSYELTLSQSTPATPGQADPQALPIPVALALFDHAGVELPLALEGEQEAVDGERVILLDTGKVSLKFRDLDSEPIPSLLRGYSAPVRLLHDAHWRDLAVLAASESDGFNRWAASDALARQVFTRELRGDVPTAEVFEAFADSLRAALADARLDPATLAEMLTLADESSLAEPLDCVDPEAVFLARARLEKLLAESLQPLLLDRIERLATSREGMSATAQANRRLGNRCLQLLCVADPSHLVMAQSGYRNAACLSDRLSALACLVHASHLDAQPELEDFAQRYRDTSTVMDKWFAVQATRPELDTVEKVQDLARHAHFCWDNPNKIHALLSSLALRNPRAFHRIDGAGYRLVADAIIRLDSTIPQVSARLTGAFASWQRLEPVRRERMHVELLRIQSTIPLSPDLADIVSRMIGQP
jgi:aminopeptidase N